MGESFDHCPPGWIRQSRKCCSQFIHNHMVVDFLPMSNRNLAIPDFCSLISDRFFGIIPVAFPKEVRHDDSYGKPKERLQD
jgi:hypothetical protein